MTRQQEVGRTQFAGRPQLPVDSTQHPDFSKAVSFGFRTGLNHFTGPGTGAINLLSDNLSYTITVTTLPEPSSAWLVSAFLAGLIAWHRCR
jgi:hypothetical protein